MEARGNKPDVFKNNEIKAKANAGVDVASACLHGKIGLPSPPSCFKLHAVHTLTLHTPLPALPSQANDARPCCLYVASCNKIVVPLLFYFYLYPLLPLLPCATFYVYLYGATGALRGDGGHWEAHRNLLLLVL